MSDSLRIVILSDTHSKHRSINQIPKGDVVIHAGDFSNVGDRDDLNDFKTWFGSLPHENRIFIAGNHDCPLHKEWYVDHGAKRFHRRHVSRPGFDPAAYADDCKESMLSPGSIYLEDSVYTIPDTGASVFVTLPIFINL